MIKQLKNNKKQLREKQHEKSKKIKNKQVSIKSETLRPLEKNKYLKETTMQFSSKIIYQEKHLSTLATSFK